VEWKFFILLYFLADDSVEIYESKDKSRNTTSGQTPAFPLFLGKIKLPKDWSNFPCKYLFVEKIKYKLKNVFTKSIPTLFVAFRIY